MDDFSSQLRATFGWVDDDEAADALATLFPRGVDPLFGANMLGAQVPAAASGTQRPVSPFAGRLELSVSPPPVAAAWAGPAGPGAVAAAPVDTAAAAAAAAAAPAAAQQEANGSAPQPRRRGRPRAEGSVYSREYLAVKRYRERQRNMMAQLEVELALRTSQLQLLTVERDVLQAHERALQTAIQSVDDTQQRHHEQSQSQSQAASQRSDGGPQGSGSRQDSAGAADSCASGDGGGGAAAQTLDPAIVARVRGYVADIRANRLRPDGTIAPIPPGDPRESEVPDHYRDLLAMPAEEALRVMVFNFETGECPAEPPADLAERLAAGLQLTEEQHSRIMSAWEIFERALDRLDTERRQLAARVEALQRGAAAAAGDGPLDAGDADQLESLLERLQNNIVRENQQWGCMSWSVMLMMEEHQIARLVLHGWPFLASMAQIAAAYTLNERKKKKGAAMQ